MYIYIPYAQTRTHSNTLNALLGCNFAWQKTKLHQCDFA